MSHSYVLLPFVIAFLIFIMRFYARENAASMQNPSFILAVITVLIALAFITVGVLSLMPPYGTLVFGIVGALLLATSIARLFMI